VQAGGARRQWRATRPLGHRWQSVQVATVVVNRRRHRWLWVVGAVVAVIVMLAGLFWFAFVPNWRPPLRDGERYGVDVCAHQGEIDWRRVAADNIGFAYIKASEGGGFTDSRFGQNWSGAGDAGLDRGAYHFFTLCRRGNEQARHFLAVAPPDPRALAPAVDLELAGNCSRRPPAVEVEAELGAFLELVEAAWGQPALLYVRDDWEDRYPVRGRLDRQLWQFRFVRRPTIDNVLVWQIHGFALSRAFRAGSTSTSCDPLATAKSSSRGSSADSRHMQRQVRSRGGHRFLGMSRTTVCGRQRCRRSESMNWR
jgi:lysozyme